MTYSGVTYPRGFTAAGCSAGIKSSGGKDLAIVINNGPVPASAGVFTSNRIVAAPVTLTREHLTHGPLGAVILNSGGANACTGTLGMDNARTTAAAVGAHIGIAPQHVGVCSTGIIGVPLPMDRILGAIPTLCAAASAHAQASLDAADAIRTTDTVAKTYASEYADGWRIGGMAKGAGMLAPGLATMLCVLTTDACLDNDNAAAALAEAVRTTFNRTDSDGCMSTNDTVLLLSSGSSGLTPRIEDFTAELTVACANLARQLLADAEGASHDIAITVTGATSEEAAEAVGRAVARSNLFKTAVFGNDPNWGRIISEVGTVPQSVAPYDPNAIDVIINHVMVCQAGGVGQDRALVDMSAREVSVVVDLHAGNASATIWTNDLTHDYVHENSAYTS
ncbi:bifunctional glutamate N-acetyltransferase/amino-acid acetyltransferase ArgJ [Schaalia suimastitidis]|uniref:bifunctional glutamate N-acetyltransferase/amino-acid acetyltransferase ArgJ n=1 Tax=Schaalia suimastitidis TaxID=121163 RepID=UPI0003F6EB13|nr:bifunctional glutamate N-acetyltransferase/amino-acid acetyltransferase ArgJ [Schaalia suimastitidis]